MSTGLGMNLGMGLGVSSASGGAPPAATGDPLSFSVTGNTILEPDGNGFGAFINGWTATVTFKGLTASSNVDAFDGQKVTLTVTDPGYTTSGTTTTVTRTIKGSITVRRPWPNNGSRQITTVGSDLQLIIALEDIIYQGSTITQVVFAAGAYPGGNASSNALTLTGASVTNSSTRPYPKPFFAWLNRQFERATGSSFNVECVAYHRHGRNGQMVACVEYTAKDPAGHSATVQRVSAPALSSIQTRGNIVEAWKASIPLSALDQATTTAAGNCKVHAKVYPWIGDSTAILDTEVSGVAWPSYDPLQSLSFCNDKNGTYGGAYAYVKAGATGGTVSATPATARADPYPTINAAYTAVTSWNNTNKGHNDHSGSTIRLMDDGAGGAVTHTISANANPAAGLCWSTIEADPLNTASVQYQLSVAQASMADLTAFGTGVTIYNNGSSTTGSSAWAVGTASTNRLSLDGCIMDMSVAGSSSGANYTRTGYFWTRNVDWKTPSSKAKALSNTNSASYNVLMLGNTAVGGVKFQQQYCTIGNITNACQISGDPSGTLPAADGLIFANNSLFNIQSGNSTTFGNQGTTYARGMAIVQNVVELMSNGTTTISFNAWADGNAANCPELLDIHNVVLGNRGNWLYCDNAASHGLEKRGVSKFSIWFSKPIKTDTFAQASGSTSDWEFCYRVGTIGVVVLCGACTEGSVPLAQSGVDPSAGPNNCAFTDSKWSGHYNPSNCYYGTSSSGYSTVTWTNDACGMVGTGTGGGDYHLTGATNNAYDRVPAGLATLAYDLGGTARKNDGTGAAGPFERTV